MTELQNHEKICLGFGILKLTYQIKTFLSCLFFDNFSITIAVHTKSFWNHKNGESRCISWIIASKENSTTVWISILKQKIQLLRSKHSHILQSYLLLLTYVWSSSFSVRSSLIFLSNSSLLSFWSVCCGIANVLETTTIRNTIDVICIMVCQWVLSSNHNATSFIIYQIPTVS